MKTRPIQMVIAIAFAGVVVLLAGIVLSIRSFNEIHSNGYSLANHFVSELGWSRSSQAAPLFNGGLIVANLAFLPLLIVLGWSMGTRLGTLAMCFGIGALLAGTCVGIWPLDQMKAHIIAALVFFCAYTIAVLLFTLAFCPRWNTKPSVTMQAAGVFCCLFAAAFLAFPKDSVMEAVRQAESFQRPCIWWLAVLEWCVVGTALLWACAASLVLWRK